MWTSSSSICYISEVREGWRTRHSGGGGSVGKQVPGGSVVNGSQLLLLTWAETFDAEGWRLSGGEWWVMPQILQLCTVRTGAPVLPPPIREGMCRKAPQQCFVLIQSTHHGWITKAKKISVQSCLMKLGWDYCLSAYVVAGFLPFTSLKVNGVSNELYLALYISRLLFESRQLRLDVCVSLQITTPR